MIKYKRRTINQKTELHDKEFVVYEDIIPLIELITNAAVKAGADKDKLDEFFNEKYKNPQCLSGSIHENTMNACGENFGVCKHCDKTIKYINNEWLS